MTTQHRRRSDQERRAAFGFQKPRSTTPNYENMKSALTKEIERFFRPEFINRLDDIIVFRPLNERRTCKQSSTSSWRKARKRLNEKRPHARTQRRARRSS